MVNRLKAKDWSRQEIESYFKKNGLGSPADYGVE
jgi:hypothetical protein